MLNVIMLCVVTPGRSD